MKSTKNTITAIMALSTALFASLSHAEITGSLSLGYSSEYEFRGATLGDDLAEGTFALESPLANDFKVGGSIWYASTNEAGAFVDNEVDYSLFISKTFAGTTLSLGHIFYTYPDYSETNTAEFYLTASRELFYGITGTLTAYYDYDLFDGWFFYADLGKSFKLSDCLSLNLNAGLGAYESYTGFDNGMNHYYAKAALAWTPKEGVTITPYVKFTDANGDFPSTFTNAPLGGDYGGTNVIGGIGASVAF